MHYLDLFCQASSQKINSQNARILFFKNVDNHLREDILQYIDISQVTGL